jgi:hypothetical protein
MSEPYFVGEGGGEFVAAGGEFGGDAAFALVKTGEHQQATIGQWPIRPSASLASQRLMLPTDDARQCAQ